MGDEVKKEPQIISSFSNQPSQNVQPPASQSVTQTTNTPLIQQTQANTQQPQRQPAVVKMDTGGQEAFQETPGGIRYRLSASVFDGLIINTPLSFIYALIVLVAGSGLGLLNGTMTIPLYIIYSFFVVAYYVYFDIKRGTTLGKEIYGMKVVDINSKQNLGFKNAAIREFVVRMIAIIPIIGALFSIINFFVILSSPQRRGIHDKAGKSQVLRYKKSWSFIKQLGLFLLLFLLMIAPMVFIFPKFVEQSEESSKCVVECMESKGAMLGSADMQNVMKLCLQECNQ